jgi:protease-4
MLLISDVLKRTGTLFASEFKTGVRVWTIIFNVFLAFTILGVIFGGIAAGLSTATSEANGGYVYGKIESTNKILTIPINGVIDVSTGSNPLSFFGGDITTSDARQAILDAADDDSIKGVILLVDSPGGTTTGATAMTDAITQYKKSGKPIWAHVTGMAASAAYWIAAGTDKITSDSQGEVGSIGVIFGPFTYYDQPISQGSLLTGSVETKGGIEETYITAGTFKDTGNPYRRLDPAEVAHYQGTVNRAYDTFVSWVSARRAIPDATIRNDLKAFLYDSEMGKKLKLVDELYGREDMYQAFATQLNLGDDYSVTSTLPSGGGLFSLLGARIFTPKKAEQTSAMKPAFCTQTRMVLALHGSPATYCQ